MTDKHLFIHIPKNAGMTIRKSPTLRSRILPAIPKRHISPEYTLKLHQTMKAHGDHHGNEHARFRDIHPDVRSKYPAFCIIRNPWDRVASRFWFARKVIEFERKVPASYADVSSFDAFLEERHKWGGKEFFWHRAVRGWYNQQDYIVDEDGRPGVECLRFGHLNTDLTQYFGLSHIFRDRPRNVTAIADTPNSKLYTERSIKIVADWYKEDIDYFGFDFDTDATRNYYREESDNNE